MIDNYSFLHATPSPKSEQEFDVIDYENEDSPGRDAMEWGWIGLRGAEQSIGIPLPS